MPEQNQMMKQFTDLCNDFAALGITIANISTGQDDRQMRDKFTRQYHDFRKAADQFAQGINSGAITVPE